MILLVTGGSASGKSEYAENRALQLAKTEQKKLIYLAAMKPFGEEAAKRIERHRQLRAGNGFETVERYTDIEGLCRDENISLAARLDIHSNSTTPSFAFCLKVSASKFSSLQRPSISV